ncbi:electron transfer flavoprotein subunit beta/FixA family protein [Ammoniphilus sp. YIM 78166]|uniref:electron transfer flavoprotein subunit beta/FixA family protein n=1 Tax=Ammoniphilus sp. YIM 78166 TaxID=1644106 RepID=UPI00106F8447|nr:electron transfer flavoprotein subunit beta/FixA family protein [Ammoniphilus sp. YIM 78166]
MNIVVLMKQVFDTEEKIIIQNGQIQEDGVEFIINPYDEYAIEEAVKWKEEVGGEVTVISYGPPRAENALRTALAMGADKAVLIEQPHDGKEADEYVLSHIFAAEMKQHSYDLVLGGNMAVDTGSGQVAIRVAEALGISHVSTITKLTIEEQKATVQRDVEGDIEVLEVTLPFVATAQQGLNEPRYPSLPGIMKAKKKPLKRVSLKELSLTEEQRSSQTTVLEQYLPAKKQAGRILTGDKNEQVRTLVQMLRSEAKVI